ncbi:MAG: hypothetical protein WB681_05705 [Candidatus Cybelea sp.]
MSLDSFHPLDESGPRLKKHLVFAGSRNLAITFLMNAKPAQVAEYLRQRLGRPVVARLAGVADANLISRWSRGAAEPSADELERMRLAVQAFMQLAHLFESEESARDWISGGNEVLGHRMPVDVIAKGDRERISAAVRAVAAAVIQ